MKAPVYYMYSAPTLFLNLGPERFVQENFQCKAASERKLLWVIVVIERFNMRNNFRVIYIDIYLYTQFRHLVNPSDFHLPQ